MKFVSDFVNAFVYKSFALCFATFKDFGVFRELMEEFQICGPRSEVFRGEISEFSEISVDIGGSHGVILGTFPIGEEFVRRFQRTLAISEIFAEFFIAKLTLIDNSLFSDKFHGYLRTICSHVPRFQSGHAVRVIFFCVFLVSYAKRAIDNKSQDGCDLFVFAVAIGVKIALNLSHNLLIGFTE